MEVPFAPHSPTWEKTDDGGCYAVLDGRKIRQDEEEDSEWVKDFDDSMNKSASDFLGFSAGFKGGMWAGDFFCGRVMIVYYGKVEEELEEDRLSNPSTS